MKQLFSIFFIILLFFGKTQNIFANQDTFTVDNVVIKGKIGNNNYEKEYIETAFRKAFQKLITNILKSEDQKKILSTDLATIKSFIQSFRIIDEEIFEEEYKAEFVVSFKEDSINQFFYEQGVFYSASQKLETIVYPIFIIDSELQIFSNNKFYEEWNDSNELQDVTFILPVENLDDINFLKNNIENLEEIDLSQLVDNYEIKNSAILILRYDKRILNVFLKTNFKGVKKLKKIEVAVKDLENKNVRDQTISKLKLFVHDLWKEQNIVDISTPSFLSLNAKIAKPEGLNLMLKKIDKINIIKNYFVQEFDNNNVVIKIKYLGKVKNLENAFLESGFNLSIKDNKWNIFIEG